jgi:phosphopantothenoylcysteine decarboxylase/phosphopantothenate--cysteine ligase
MKRVKAKRAVLGVTGSIAAYKAAELIRRLMSQGVDVTVVMTESAVNFISPLTLGVLSKKRVYCSLFEAGSTAVPGDGDGPEHISLAENCDLLVIAPCTANVVGKLAHGLADDLLSTVALAVTSPILIAPAMNDAMYANPVVRSNIKLLKGKGVRFVEPEEGELASGKLGKGRLAGIEKIVDEVKRILLPAFRDDFSGKTVVVSAGPTREYIDQVRFLSNPSTGRMGYALAGAARERGANVILISGPTHLAPPQGVRTINVETALEMRKQVIENSRKADIVVMAAAVANYRPKKKAETKIKKGKSNLTLEFEENPDILAELGKKKGRKVLVGFSLETRGHVRRAREKLREKNLDLIVANDPLQDGAGFGVETNIVQIIDREGNVEKLPKLPKEEIAHLILDRLLPQKGESR